ncbi:FAD-binding protein [Clostridium perfringens]|uniref:Pyridine nucleotide-disulfide oxidoreductase n=1 Tax=Clostridium perfringens F262 TaxID=883064 RepID=A0AAV3FC75_CLOPF|nr:FAD-binding protein [Clostridium perfringens]EIA16948.1 pyridine nucleotide-disulfide oxidoreductase [Clostridium perfringens F262]ELC8366317.1 FAD-binding protein [Clostridium perfringens]MBO3343047.1 FAD-binding protein [Clostridium perfringens]MBO3346119.1 FAD-binding protein [Clostridium perfringens]MBO3349191.1 FAD-binding protein [Clostridium perfringens]
MREKVKLKKDKECDVFVMGAGIAGIMAAIEASNNGQKVIISSSSNIFSGSSFYPGTWGLGLIGPEDRNDEEDLAKTIKKVGCNVVDEELVETFVKNINPSIDLLKEMGVKLKEANNSGEKEFIPCFDHKNRNWNGILFESAKKVLDHKLKSNEVLEYPFSEVIEIVKEDNKIIGVILINSLNKLEFIKCKALVIASGGIGGLFKYRLNTTDITGMGQALALKVGCNLINIEFMQMMPGYIKPCPKTIFNEKTFKYIEARNEDGEDVFKGIENLREKLEKRSTYGPFTSRLDSKDIDYAIFKEFMKNKNGVTVRYKDSLKNNMPEFIEVYFKWLKENKHLTPDDEINIGIFFHAANGGISINKKAETKVDGLFAAGECTGGMHGADRIGGLSTANGLVFGRIAGESASRYASSKGLSEKEEVEFALYEIEGAGDLILEVQEIMFKNAMIEKSEVGVKDSLLKLEEISKRFVYKKEVNMENLRNSYRLENNILLCKAILKAIDLRKESRGSHYRYDYPKANKNMDKMIMVELDDDIKAYFKEN